MIFVEIHAVVWLEFEIINVSQTGLSILAILFQYIAWVAIYIAQLLQKHLLVTPIIGVIGYGFN